MGGSKKRRGVLSFRSGPGIVHGLNFDEATKLLDSRQVGGSVTQAASACHTATFGSQLAPETAEELARFAAWYGELGESDKISLPPALRNAARNLIRQRGYRLHQAPSGKCTRIAQQISAAISSCAGSGDLVGSVHPTAASMSCDSEPGDSAGDGGTADFSQDGSQTDGSIRFATAPQADLQSAAWYPPKGSQWIHKDAIVQVVQRFCPDHLLAGALIGAINTLPYLLAMQIADQGKHVFQDEASGRGSEGDDKAFTIASTAGDEAEADYMTTAFENFEALATADSNCKGSADGECPVDVLAGVDDNSKAATGPAPAEIERDGAAGSLSPDGHDECKDHDSTTEEPAPALTEGGENSNAATNPAPAVTANDGAAGSLRSDGHDESNDHDSTIEEPAQALTECDENDEDEHEDEDEDQSVVSHANVHMEAGGAASQKIDDVPTEAAHSPAEKKKNRRRRKRQCIAEMLQLKAAALAEANISFEHLTQMIGRSYCKTASIPALEALLEAFQCLEDPECDQVDDILGFIATFEVA